MRILVILLTTVALATPAFARGAKHQTEQKADDSKTKANDKDYKAALDRLPVPTQKYDAWRTVRPDAKP